MKIFQRVLYSALAAFIGFSAVTMDFTVTESEATFEQTAQEVVDDIVFGWNLGNSFDAYIGTTFNCQGLESETCWGNPKITKSLVDTVAYTDINAIRLPVTWYNHMNPDTYVIDDAWFDRVEEVVNYILEDDCYCILNVHHDTGENGWLRASNTNFQQNEQIFELIWEQIAERFESYGDKLIFEGFNEILDDSNEWVNPDSSCITNVNTLNQTFVDTVRASGGNNASRVLICNTYAASGNPYVTGGWKLPNDTANNKIIAECHIYQPFYFTTDASPDETTWQKNKMYLDEQLDAVKTNFVDKGIPAIIGEFGAADKGNMDEIISWADYYVEKTLSYGIKCFWWDNGTTADYRMFNRNSLKCVQEDLLNTILARAKGGAYEKDTTVYGDANDDGNVTVADAVMLQKWLLCAGELTNWKNVDLIKDDRIDVFDLCLLKCMLVQKDNMCASGDGWTSWVDTTNGADADVNYLDNGMEVNVRNGGQNPWEVQATYGGITLEQGAEYKISFDYSATAPLTMDVNVMQDYDPYMPYYNSDMDFTSEVQHFEDTFTAEKTDKKTRISFNFGAQKTAFDVKITNLSLIKLSSGSTSTEPDEPDTPVVTDGDNLCADASNWGSWVYEYGAAATATKTSDGMTIDVTKSGEEEWYIQGSYANLTLEKGATYRVEFDYSATKDVTLGFHVQQNYDPYGQYHYTTIDYNKTVQNYSAEFKMTETDDNVVIVFNCGDADSAGQFSVTVENLSLIRI